MGSRKESPQEADRMKAGMALIAEGIKAREEAKRRREAEQNRRDDERRAQEIAEDQFGYDWWRWRKDEITGR